MTYKPNCTMFVLQCYGSHAVRSVTVFYIRGRHLPFTTWDSRWRAGYSLVSYCFHLKTKATCLRNIVCLCSTKQGGAIRPVFWKYPARISDGCIPNGNFRGCTQSFKANNRQNNSQSYLRTISLNSYKTFLLRDTVRLINIYAKVFCT